MQYGFITFWDEYEKPLKITKSEHEIILRGWKAADHIVVKGNVIHKKTIKRISPPPKPEPFELPEPKRTPLSKEFLTSMRKKFSQKFSA